MSKDNEWRSIGSAPTDSMIMFVVRAFNVEIKPGTRYTSDPYCVWSDKGRFARWPHDFAPTHWMPLPLFPPGWIPESTDD